MIPALRLAFSLFRYRRVEVLAGFVNGIFLIFIAGTVVLEAIERLSEPPEIHGTHVLIVRGHDVPSLSLPPYFNEPCFLTGRFALLRCPS